MRIKRISVQNLGSIEFFECDFEDTLNIINSRDVSELSRAIQFVANCRGFYLPKQWVSRNTQIEALVCFREMIYKIVARKEPNKSSLRLYAYDGEDKDMTKEYLYATTHCIEQDLSEIFEGNISEMSFKPIQYLDEDRYYTFDELSRRTDRVSEIKAFRSYLKGFIKDFQPECMREGKRYELCLDENRRYAVKCKGGDDLPVCLSESEQVLFRYLCFLKTAEFWQGFEELRNLNDVKKPILVKNFIERLDESIDIQDVLERTKRLNRQVIMLTI